MTERLVRRRAVSDLAADAVRVGGALSVIVAAILFGARGAGVVAITLPGLLLPRAIGLRPWADIVVSVTLLTAAWTNVVDLYELIDWTDAVVHFALTGALAACGYLLLAQLGIVVDPAAREFRPRAGIVLTTVLGLALSAAWEMFEWFGRLFVEVFVTYDDTIYDLAAGGLGALCAGLAVSRIPLRRPRWREGRAP